MVPIVAFGQPGRIVEIKTSGDGWWGALVEDSAESLGSFYKNRHPGPFGKVGAFSFNGNKIITSGGGGVIVTDDKVLAKRAKHITTTAKIPHSYEYMHDEVGFNYRMPNLNASLLVAQMENLQYFLNSKRELAMIYKNFCDEIRVSFFSDPQHTISTYWLHALLVHNRNNSDESCDF